MFLSQQERTVIIESLNFTADFDKTDVYYVLIRIKNIDEIVNIDINDRDYNRVIDSLSFYRRDDQETISERDSRLIILNKFKTRQ